MFNKKLLIFLLLLVLLPTGLCFAESGNGISGQLVTGYRILTVEPADKNIDFTVFRGDYIKFRFPENFGPLPFAVPALKYKGTLLPNPDKSPFFKMKSAGTYAFSLGEIIGNIKVVELVLPDYTELTAQEAADLLRTSSPFILDVRTPWEHKKLSIAGSHLIPIQELQARIQELEPRKEEVLFIYCATGNRSTVAAQILANRGFKRIYNLRHGIYDWARKGFPITLP